MKLAAIVLLASTASAQLATSTNHQLDGLRVDAGGGGMCSGVSSAIAAADVLGTDGILTSANARAEVGTLSLFDPLDTDLPTVFAVTPPYGTSNGGTQVEICGLHFVRSGLAGSVTVDIAGAPATGVGVVSDSLVNATVPAGPYGPNDVTVTTALGAANQAGGFVHTPALRVSPHGFSTLRLENFGVAGGLFETWASTTSTSIPLPPYGLLEIGPAVLFKLVGGTPYPAPDGISTLQLPVVPGLAGVTLYLQSIAILSFVPLDARLVNSSSVLFF